MCVRGHNSPIVSEGVCFLRNCWKGRKVALSAAAAERRALRGGNKRAKLAANEGRISHTQYKHFIQDNKPSLLVAKLSALPKSGSVRGPGSLSTSCFRVSRNHADTNSTTKISTAII